MRPLSEIYPDRFFRNRNKLAWRAPIICNAIMGVFSPRSVIDIGCATGDIVKDMLDAGIDAFGMEGAITCMPHCVIPEERLIVHDLRLPFSVLLRTMERFDLGLCFEVFEHIEPEYADIMLTNITALSDRLLVSAAPPGQGGHHHVNCQEPEYWHEKMDALGYRHNQEIESRMRGLLLPWSRKPGIKAIYKNLIYYEGKYD